MSLFAVEKPEFSVGDGGVQLISCDATLRATADGEGKASWLDATLQFFAGVDGTPAFDSATIAAAQIQSAWGDSAIAGGQAQEAHWKFSATAPFRIVFESHYQIEGQAEKATAVTIACGPDMPAGTPGPSVTALDAQGPAGNLEPGDTLSVEYSASSPVGLWSTTVSVTGPCELHQIFPDSLRSSVHRTVHLVFPANCALGLPVTVTVLATDVGLQRFSRALSTGLALVDSTPPRVWSVVFPSPVDPFTSAMRADYFAGDSIVATATVSDNRGVHAIVWQLQPAGVTDSLVLPDRMTDSLITVKLPPIPIPTGYTGSLQLHVYARDAVGLTSDTILPSPDRSAVVHPTIQRPVTIAKVPGMVEDVAVDSRKGVAYLRQWEEHRIAVLSLSALTISENIALPSPPGMMDLSPSGDTLLVLLPKQAALGVVDLRQSSPQLSIVPLTNFDDTTIDQSETPIRMAANGKVFVGVQGPQYGDFRFLEVDLATGAQHIRTDVSVDGVPIAGLTDDRIARSLDHTVLVFGDAMSYAQRYDAATDSFGPTLRPGSNIVADLSVDATGRWVAKARSIFDESLHYVRNVGVPGPSSYLPATIMSAAGDVVYEAVPYEGIVRVRVDDGAVLDRTTVPIKPLFLRISDDGTVLVGLEQTLIATNTLAIVDLR